MSAIYTTTLQNVRKIVSAAQIHGVGHMLWGAPNIWIKFWMVVYNNLAGEWLNFESIIVGRAAEIVESCHPGWENME